MLSAAGAALIILFTANFFYQYLPTWSAYLRDHRGALIGVCVGMIAAMALVSYWLMNKPGSVDFLIATDSEMKKVNWTSRQELIGSTKVVIFFLFTIAILLFVIDVVFGYFFAWIHVLKQTPF